MRKFALLLLVPLFIPACTDVPSGPSYDSVRERLSTTATSLYIHDESSSGTITAQQHVGDGWNTAQTPLYIQRGYVRAKIDESGQLAIQRLEFDLAPIQLGVFERPAQLQDVHVRLAEPMNTNVEWTSDDEAKATLAMPFEFDWTVKLQGDGPYPLSPQKLGPTNVAVTLGGDGDHVSAQIDIRASGALWNWADLVQMTDLSMSLDAETAY